MVNSELKNKVVLITGANKGLGLEMSRQLGQHGLTILNTKSTSRDRIY
ncbi:MAG: hypothetical protein V7K19_07035 [Nostoc sp.]